MSLIVHVPFNLESPQTLKAVSLNSTSIPQAIPPALRKMHTVKYSLPELALELQLQIVAPRTDGPYI